MRVCICAGRVHSTSFSRSVYSCLPFSEMRDHIEGCIASTPMPVLALNEPTTAWKPESPSTSGWGTQTCPHSLGSPTACLLFADPRRARAICVPNSWPPVPPHHAAWSPPLLPPTRPLSASWGGAINPPLLWKPLSRTPRSLFRVTSCQRLCNLSSTVSAFQCTSWRTCSSFSPHV